MTIAATQEWSEFGTSVMGTSGDTSVVMYGTPGTARRTVIALHGRNLTSVTWSPSAPTAYEHVRALVRRHYAVVAIDATGTTAWSKPAAMTAITNAVNTALARFGGTKVGLAGFSMGCLEALNWAKRNPTKIAGAFLMSPCTDLSWAYGPAGYTPAYGSISASQATFQPEINAAFACTTGTYATSTAGYRVYDEYASWRGLCPIKLIHADDDATIPVAQSKAFVTGVSDSKVTLHELATGGHGPWTGIDPSETAAFFDAASWS